MIIDRSCSTCAGEGSAGPFNDGVALADAEWRENKPEIASRQQPKPAQFSSSSPAMHSAQSFPGREL